MYHYTIFRRLASLSIGAPLGNLEGGSYTGDFEILMKEGSGNGASVSVVTRGTPKVMPNEALERGICFHRGPVWGNMGGRSFPRAFERRVKFLFIRRTFIEEFERHVKEGSGNGQLSFIGAPFGEPEGGSFTGTL